ncbi:MAG: glutathione peroxidase [Moraxellaceae bacterium]|nr:glutathione peroxidase [Moraxellaceae bacterium]
MSTSPSSPSQLPDLPLQRLDGTPINLRDYAGEVLLIVNTASACGLTPQYEALESLQREYFKRGFSVLGFPCNQFGAQEPGTAEQIASFCSTNYEISFPLFAKADVNGAQTQPLYIWLKQSAPGPEGGADIGWNFAKFLVGRDGKVIARYAPSTAPDELRATIESAL